MAVAERKSVVVEKVVEEVQAVITLELTREEAQVLRDVYYACVSGTGERRQLFQGIAYALQDAGIYPGDDSDFTGCVTFK